MREGQCPVCKYVSGYVPYEYLPGLSAWERWEGGKPRLRKCREGRMATDGEMAGPCRGECHRRWGPSVEKPKTPCGDLGNGNACAVRARPWRSLAAEKKRWPRACRRAGSDRARRAAGNPGITGCWWCPKYLPGAPSDGRVPRSSKPQGSVGPRKRLSPAQASASLRCLQALAPAAAAIEVFSPLERPQCRGRQEAC